MTQRAQQAVDRLTDAAKTLHDLSRHKEANAVDGIALTFALLPEEIQEEFLEIVAKAANGGNGA